MKYALIGCGRISANHIAAALNSGYEIVALCDLSITAAEALKVQFSLSNAVIYNDYLLMIEHESIDVISIATPSGSHAEIAIGCCRKGIHVIIEKPVALSLSDALKIQDTAKAYGVKVTVCHQNRYNKAVTKAIELVRSGALGDLYCVSANILWNRGEKYYSQSAWRGTWKQDGGVLMNQGIHNIDLLRWFAGSEIQSVSAMISNVSHPYIEVEDIGVAIVGFKNGCVGTINCTSNVYPSNLEETLYIMGSKGTIKLGGKSVNRIDVLNVSDIADSNGIISEYSNEPPNVYGYGHAPLFKNFMESVLNDKEPYISLKDASSSLELVLGIYKSARTNSIVGLPLEDFSTMDMVGWNDGI